MLSFSRSLLIFLIFHFTLQYIRLYVLFYTGLLPFCSITPDFLEIPMPRALIPLTKSRTTRFVLRILDFLTMSPVLFDHLNKRGLQVCVMTSGVERVLWIERLCFGNVYVCLLTRLFSFFFQTSRKVFCSVAQKMQTNVFVMTLQP